jgi:uncharacterized protein (TIGR03118 family)
MDSLMKTSVVARTLSAGVLVASALLGAPERAAAQTYTRTDLVTNICCESNGTRFDPTLIGGWGVAFGTAGAAWVVANSNARSNLYDGAGRRQALVVRMENAPDFGNSSPTGVAANGGSGFKVANDSGDFGPARFLFATQEGTITGWTPVTSSTQNTHAHIAVDRSAHGGDVAANYTGLAVGKDVAGDRLYAADFAGKRIDMFDGTFTPLRSDFNDPNLPAGYAPFNVRVLDGRVYVAYAVPDQQRFKPVTGPGSGIIDVFGTDGTFQSRLITGGPLNAPWGMALAPNNFGPLSGLLLVANTGDGRINAFKPTSGEFAGALTSAAGPIVIDGLHGIDFGNGVSGQPTNSLFYAAAPTFAAVGVFGRVDVAPRSSCPGDFNVDGRVTNQDIFDFLNAWFAADRRTDVDRADGVDVQDIFAFLGAWFSGCA